LAIGNKLLVGDSIKM